jgi:hypothetical protein
MSSKQRPLEASVHFSPQFSPQRLFFGQNQRVGLGHLRDQKQDSHPFRFPAHRDPTHPVPPLIGVRTPVSLCILICSNEHTIFLQVRIGVTLVFRIYDADFAHVPNPFAHLLKVARFQAVPHRTEPD